MNSMNTWQADLFSETPSTFDLPDAEIHYFPNFFSIEASDCLLKTLNQKINWRQNTIGLYGKKSLVPRLEAWYGDTGKSYSYSGIQMDPTPWIDELLEIKLAIEKHAKKTFNSVLVNYYRNGRDKVAWHSDDEKELGKNPIIGSISFGAERKFKLRHKSHKINGLKAEINLKHGSLLLMKGETQHNWMHEIPRTSHQIGPRVNLTYRYIR